jgi:hypothetical protein
MQSFYRFRSVDALLGKWKELDQQEIYFSAPEQLNDPLEGFKDLYWQGDEIVWRNLFKHYLLCLLRAYVVTKVSGQDYRPTLVREDPVIARFALPTPKSWEIYNRICGRFFGSYGIDEVPALLARCRYRFGRDTLEFCLRAVHPVAVNAVLQIYGEDGPESAANAITSASSASVEDVVSSMKHVLSQIAADDGSISADQLSTLFSVGSHMAKQVELITYLRETDEHSRVWQPLFAPFPEQYVDQLRHFVFFKWYAACFVADPNQAAMWGNYGDSHRGVCLRFRAHDGTDGKPTLKLHGVIGASGNAQEVRPLYGDIPVIFEAMTYVDKLLPIDFFRSLARLPIQDLKSDWYTDESGNRSECGDGVLSSNSEWRQNNLAAFQALTTTKLRYWEHEREYRLVLMSALDRFSEVADRKLRYQFADLEGIVFGIKTPLSEKEEIIKIVLAKCEREGRKTFTFSQALYVPYSGKIETRPLDLLRIA